MAQVIYPQGPNFGQSLGQGITSLFEELGQRQRQKAQQQGVSKGLEALGYKPEEAFQLSMLQPEILQQVVKQKLAEPSQQAFAQAILGEQQPLLQGQRPPQLTAQQALQLAQLRETQQANIVKENAPFLKNLEAQVTPAKSLKKDVEEALRLVQMKDAQGKPIVQLGAVKGLIPGRLQNAETQALVAKFNEIVTKKAQLGRGVPSRMRLLLEQASKPQTWMNPRAVEYLLNEILKSTTSEELSEIAKDQIISEHGNRQPRGLENLTKNRKKILEALPDPREFDPNTIIKAAGKNWQISGGTWVPVSEGAQ